MKREHEWSYEWCQFGESSVAGAGAAVPLVTALRRTVVFLDILKTGEGTSRVVRCQKNRAVPRYIECHNFATTEERLTLKKFKRSGDSDYTEWLSIAVELPTRLLQCVTVEYDHVGRRLAGCRCKLKSTKMRISSVYRATVELKQRQPKKAATTRISR